MHVHEIIPSDPKSVQKNRSIMSHKIMSAAYSECTCIKGGSREHSELMNINQRCDLCCKCALL